MGVNVNGRIGPHAAGVRLYPYALKTALRAGKDVYLDTARPIASRPGFHKLVLLRTGNNLIAQPGKWFLQRSTTKPCFPFIVD